MKKPTVSGDFESAVLNVGGMQFASEQTKVAVYLEKQLGVASVEVNPVSQTATITYNSQQIGVDQLQELVAECGYHCSGEALPRHLCAPATQAPPTL